MAEDTQAGSAAPEEAVTVQQEIDYSGETLEQLEARFQQGEGLIDDDPQPEPETVEVEDPPKEEPETDAAPDGETQEAQPKAEVEPEFDEAASIEEEQRLEKLKRDTFDEKRELILSREATRAGNLQKQVDELRQALVESQQQAPPARYEEADARPAQPRAPIVDNPLQAMVTELQQESRARAVEAEYNSFVQSHPDAVGLMEKMAPSIQEQVKGIEEMNLNNKSLAKMLRFTLSTAYADIKLQEVLSQRKEALERRASSAPERKRAKQVASVSGSGGSPAPRARQKSVEDLTAEEADKALIAEFGTGHTRRSRR